MERFQSENRTTPEPSLCAIIDRSISPAEKWIKYEIVPFEFSFWDVVYQLGGGESYLFSSIDFSFAF